MSNPNDENKNLSTDMIHKAIALELLEEMNRGKDVSTLLSKDKIMALIAKIQDKDANYYLCHLDLNNTNEANVNHFNSNKNLLYKALLKEVQDNVKVDIEFYKIGQSCSGLKQRHAIITKDAFFSSTESMAKFNEKKAKDKTNRLSNSEMFLENIKQKDKKSEWSNTTKPYRMRINYIQKEKNNSKSSFFLYFKTEEEMKKIEELLFGMRKGKDKIQLLGNDLKFIERSIQGSYFTYASLKLLEVKAIVKKRKALLNQMKSVNNAKMNLMLSFGKEMAYQLLNTNVKKTQKVEYTKALYYSEFDTIIKEPATKVRSIGVGNDRAQYISDDYHFNNVSGIKANLAILKRNFPKSFNRNHEKGSNVCFALASNAELEDNDAIININPNDMRDKKYVTLDKGNQRMILSEEDSDNTVQLDKNKIYEISAVLLNVNKQVNKIVPNYMVICGPKIDETVPMEFQYNGLDKKILDPEALGLKMNNAPNKNTVRDLVRIQIFHLTYQLLPAQLDQIKILNGDKGIEVRNPLSDLYFFLTITLRGTMKKKTMLLQPKTHSNNITIVEFNLECLLDEKEFENNSSVFIDVFMIPVSCFEDISSPQARIIASDYLNPINLGQSEISLDSIQSNTNEYPVLKNGSLLSDDNRLLVNCIRERSKAALTTGFYGKEFILGGYSFVPLKLSNQDIMKKNTDAAIPPDIKEKYYDIQYNDDGDVLFRPNDLMKEERFIQEIQSTVSPEDLRKILYNKKFPFLPMCEKFVNKESLQSSVNIPNEEKSKMMSYHQGDWIYKATSVKLAPKNKNLGITERKEMLAQNKYLDAINEYKIPSMQDKDKIELIDDNNFDVLDFNDIHIETCKGFNNFQWKIGLPFRNNESIRTFLAFLKRLRSDVNLRMKLLQQSTDQEIFIQALLNCYSKEMNEDITSCNLQVVGIEFISSYELQEDCTIDMIISKFQGGRNNANKTLFECFENKQCNYINSILNKQEMMTFYNSLQNLNIDQITIANKTLIKANIFNNGVRKIKFFNSMTKEIQCKRNIDREFRLIFNLKGTKKTLEFNTEINLHHIINSSRNAERYLTPIYFENDQEKILGRAYINCWAINQQTENQDFETIYQQAFDIELSKTGDNNLRDLMDSQMNYGRYEPNVFKRVLVKKVLEKYKQNNTITEEQLVNYLRKKCVITPNKVINNNILYPEYMLMNLSTQVGINVNSFYKKFRMKIYDNSIRENFIKFYSTSEWKIFFKPYNKNEIPQSNETMFYMLPPKNTLQSNKYISKLRELIYLGIPMKKGRIILWEYLLDTEKLYQNTKDKLNEKNASKENIYNHFASIANHKDCINIIFTLIDNDTNYITPLSSKFNNQDIKTIKTIAKAFFLWTELDIKLNDTSKDSKYIYWVGILGLIQRLYNHFDSSSDTFWLIIGLAQVIELFKQRNPIYNENMSMTSLYVLVTKLILQSNFKEIYNKFHELNFPIEFFLSKNISTLYCDYFSTDILMRVLDIFILEASLKQYSDDKLQYLRILCTIPITLFELNSKKIIECNTVSELETVMEDLIAKTYNTSKLIEAIDRNAIDFFSAKNIFEKYTNLNPKTQWDNKRNKMEYLFQGHFKSIQKENVKYLSPLSKNKTINECKLFIDNYREKLVIKLENIKEMYKTNKENTMGIYFQISKLCSIIIQNNPLENKMTLYVQLSDNQYHPEKTNKRGIIEKTINYNQSTGTITNLNDLFFEIPFGESPNSYVNFIFVNSINRDLGWFSLDIAQLKLMEIDTIVLESYPHQNVQLMLEIAYMKYTLNSIKSDDFTLYNNLFNSPNYIHNEDIDLKLNENLLQSSSYIKNLPTIINSENNTKMKIVSTQTVFSQVMSTVDLFKRNNICSNKTEKLITKDSKNAYANLIIAKVEDLLKSMTPNETYTIVMEWLKETKNSFEEILYSLVLIDKESCSIAEKMLLLFNIAQMSHYLVQEKECATVDKLKEMIYSLYKRYMIYFTRNDVDRMIDFLVHKERLFIIKTAIVYSDHDTNYIQRYTKDNEPFDMSLNQNISYQNIAGELNAHMAYLINHQNIKSISNEMLTSILKDILDNASSKVYKENKFNMIHIAISSDNIHYTRQYKFTLSPLNVEEINPRIIERNSQNNEQIINECLCNQLSSININNSYSDNTTLNFSQFKKIFFELPFISDLLRVSCAYISENKDIINKPFDVINISIGLEARSPEDKIVIIDSYYLSNNVNSNARYTEDKQWINCQVTPSWTIQDLRDKIFEEMSTTKQGNYDKDELLHLLHQPERFKFFIINSLHKTSKSIGFFECLSSNLELKQDVKNVDIQFLLSASEWTKADGGKIVLKEYGYTKFYYTPNDYDWRKCWITNQQRAKHIYFKCCNTPTSLQMIGEGDYIGLGNIDIN